MQFEELDVLIDRLGPAETVRVIDPFLTEARKLRIEQVLSGRLESVQVAVERPEDPHNAAAIVRSAEALGAMHVHVIDAAPRALDAPSTTQGAFCWVHTHHHATLSVFLATARTQGMVLAGATMDGALCLDALPLDAPLCVLFGNEGTGLTEEARAACDLSFRIPMFGMSESMNLSVCAAITLYSVTRARRATLGRSGDLLDERLLRERARYYARSVERRLLEVLVAR